jgi:GNAT superfamily N-acetyltransferase
LRELFHAGRFAALELGAGDLAAVQRLFESNPGYHQLVAGRAPTPSEAQEEFAARPPCPFGKKWLIGFEEERGELVGVADVISDIFGPGVWTVGLFFLATSLHGSGAARSLYEAMEAWMKREGALWSRLGVVEGNARAARFWEKAGYAEVRKRHGVEIGEKVNALSVMAKPLAGGTLAQYLALVSRDRPETPDTR